MDGQCGVTRSITDEVHSSCIQGDQMEGGRGVTRKIIHELLFSEFQ